MEEKEHTLLVVDDSKISLEFMDRALANKYQVLKANSGADALEILHENYIDLVLSDYNMPEMTGLELFAVIDEKYSGVGKILVTAYSDTQVVIDAMNSGSVDKCIGKPWSNEKHIPILQDSLVSQEKKKLEAQMIHNSKLASLGELAAGIVHELNNPLTFIDANLKNVTKFLNKIIAMYDSYDDLNVPDETRQEIEKRKKEINKEYGDLPLVKCNITKLSQVFMNLLVNACHAIKEKGEIKIKTSIEDEMAVISIFR